MIDLSLSDNWGVLVESHDGIPIYSHNADKFFIPASNVKLFTTAAALQLLDPQSLFPFPGRVRFTVRQCVIRINRRSDNPYSEALYKLLGESPAITQALTQLGLDSQSFHIVDGAGLSYDNLATPRVIVSLLRIMESNSIWMSSFPVAGLTGTLQLRFEISPLSSGKVRAKTGALLGINVLSGYTTKYIFSILLNNSKDSAQKRVKTIDNIVEKLCLIEEQELKHRG